MSATTAFGIALGSNLGDRHTHLERGVDQLLARVPGARLAAGSALYETDPVDCAPGTQAFLNTVVEIHAALSPQQMHAHLVAVERLAGRAAKRGRNDPRTLDLDLLYAGGQVLADPALTVPHPRLHLRRFVLRPLAEIRPGLVLPGFTEPVSRLLESLADNPAAVRLAGSWKHHLPA